MSEGVIGSGARVCGRRVYFGFTGGRGSGGSGGASSGGSGGSSGGGKGSGGGWMSVAPLLQELAGNDDDDDDAKRRKRDYQSGDSFDDTDG